MNAHAERFCELWEAAVKVTVAGLETTTKAALSKRLGVTRCALYIQSDRGGVGAIGPALIERLLALGCLDHQAADDLRVAWLRVRMTGWAEGERLSPRAAAGEIIAASVDDQPDAHDVYLRAYRAYAAIAEERARARW